MSYYDPPEGRMCLNCDQELEKEWPSARDSEWICKNPNCKDSPDFVPFLKLPNVFRYRYVNDGDVSIRIRSGDHTYDDLVILRMAEGDRAYGWFIEQLLMEDEYQTEPRYFKTLDQTVKDAAEYLKQRVEWDHATELLDEFLKVQA